MRTSQKRSAQEYPHSMSVYTVLMKQRSVTFAELGCYLYARPMGKEREVSIKSAYSSPLMITSQSISEYNYNFCKNYIFYILMYINKLV